MDEKHRISTDSSPFLVPHNISTSSDYLSAAKFCSVPTVLIVFAHISWFILFPYLRRKWNPKRKMMSNLHIESIALIVFHLAYRLPCIIHLFSFDNPYMNRKEYGYLFLPISLVLIFVGIKLGRYCYKRRNYPQDLYSEDILIVPPSEFHEETLDLPDQHSVSSRTRQHHYERGEYQSIEGNEDCINPYNIPRLEETRTILNFLIIFSLVFLIFVVINPDTCFQGDPLPRYLMCAVYIGHLTSVVHKRIMYDGNERPHLVSLFAVVMLSISICMFHAYEWHESTKVIVIINLEIMFGAAAIYTIICRILARYTPTKSEIVRTIFTCLPYLILTVCTVIAGITKVKVGLSLSKCT